MRVFSVAVRRVAKEQSSVGRRFLELGVKAVEYLSYWLALQLCESPGGYGCGVFCLLGYVLIHAPLRDLFVVRTRGRR